MGTANYWIRGAFILFPVVAVLTHGFGCKTDESRAIAAVLVGAVLWFAQYLTMPPSAIPAILIVYFVGVVITAMICFFLRGIQEGLRNYRKK